MTAKHRILAEATANECLSADTHLLTLQMEPSVAQSCLPGQFFNLRPVESSAPLLRRPISICDARESGEVDFLVRLLGDGTRLLCGKSAGETLDVIGPLGNPFAADFSRPALMIAGGVGVAPLYFLTRRMFQEAAQAGAAPPEITFCYGARTAADFVLLDRIEPVVRRLVLTTEDGSRGEKGFVTHGAQDFLTGGAQTFICGPSPMMQAALLLLREKGLAGQLSLENQMGCGVGACMGCVVPGRNGPIRVCCDGPVVSSEQLDFVLGGR